MKRYLSVCAALLLCAGCFYEPYRLPAYQTDLPLEPTDTAVLYFGKATPAGKYYPMVPLGVEGPPDTAVLRQMLVTLAADVGTHAVVGVEQEAAYPGLSRWLRLKGTGVVLADSLDYVRFYPRGQYVYRYRDSTDQQPALVHETTFSPTGKMLASEGDSAMYEYLVRNYSLKFLLQDQQQWGFLENSNGRIVARQHFVDTTYDDWDLRVELIYEGSNVAQMRLRYPNEVTLSGLAARLAGGTLPKRQVLNLRYDAAGFPVEKVVLFDELEAFREAIYYDSLARLDHTILYKSAGGKLYPLLQTVYGYHEPSEVP